MRAGEACRSGADDGYRNALLNSRRIPRRIVMLTSMISNEALQVLNLYRFIDERSSAVAFAWPRAYPPDNARQGKA